MHEYNRDLNLIKIKFLTQKKVIVLFDYDPTEVQKGSSLILIQLNFLSVSGLFF
jgi:hypothetical protein